MLLIVMNRSGGHDSFWVFGEIVHLDTIQGRGHESRIRGLHPCPLMQCPGPENRSLLKTCENMISWSSRLHSWSPSTSSLCVSFEPRIGSGQEVRVGCLWILLERRQAFFVPPKRTVGK